MPVQGKSVYDPPAPGDGVRVLVTQYWPRGVTREQGGTYVRALAPSRELLRAFQEERIDWDEYRVGYLREIASSPVAQAEIGRLAALARSQVVTLMCVCRDDQQCHRSLLRQLVEKRMREPA